MCGICGVIGGPRGVVEPAVRKMMRSMVHRGPDDEGYAELSLGTAEDGPIAGFGFRRLAIQDLSSAGHQPMFHPATGDCLIFNGEIYNFRDLRLQLQLDGTRFRGGSDSEVLLHALSTWGEAAVEKLQGMYAFAFHHAATRRILLCRDPLGIKPLYVARRPDAVVFASEIRALQASGRVPGDLDVAGIASMLAYGAVQAPLTIFEGIRSFPPGTMEWIDSERRGPPARRYWGFPRRSGAGDGAVTAAGRVANMLRESVHKHLVADVPVGVFLSAGIDSTIIASYAREFTPQVTAFTVGFGALADGDESEIAAGTAAHLGIRHVGVQVDATMLPEAWHDWFASSDSPSIDGFNTYLVSRQLAAEGVVVGLSGLGADELFGGYNLFSRAPRWSRMLRTLALVPGPARGRVVSLIGRLDGRFAASEKLADLVAGDTTVAGVARSLRRTFSNARLASMRLQPAAVGLADDYLPAPPLRRDPDLDGDSFNTVSRLELTHYMGDTLLRDTDANSMRHSLEVRVPFLDLPLVDYVAGLPGRVKCLGGTDRKSLLRRACHDVLPPKVRERPKTGFTLPIGFWMRHQMRDACEAAIERLERTAVLDGAAVRRVWGDFLASPRSQHWSRPLALVVLGQSIG